jgi:RimJ/RimL family protein N-acetyltransferase
VSAGYPRPVTTGSAERRTGHHPLEGDLVRLRAVEHSDVEWVNAHFWNPNVTRFLEAVWPESTAGTEAFIASARASDTVVYFLIETLAGEPAGACSLDGISARTRTGSLGIWIDEQRWNEGLGTDAVRTLCRFGFREMNLHRIQLHVFDFNERGMRAYEKVGFREEGRLRGHWFVDGRRIDVVVMGLLADELLEADR